MRIQFKPIIPPRPNMTELDREMMAGISEVRERAVSYMRATIAFWDQKPKVNRKTHRDRGSISFEVWIEDEVYTYLNDGVAGRIIYAVNAQALSFRSQYTAKTTPRVLRNRRGGSSGDRIARKYVNWPGIEPRNFEATVSDAIEKDVSIVEFYIERGVSGTGYGA